MNLRLVYVVPGLLGAVMLGMLVARTSRSSAASKEESDRRPTKVGRADSKPASPVAREEDSAIEGPAPKKTTREELTPDQILSNLFSRNGQKRGEAFDAVMNSKDAALARRAVAKLIGSKDMGHRRLALFLIASHRMRDRVFHVMNDLEVPVLKLPAARTLQTLGDPRAISALQKTYADENLEVKRTVAQALGGLNQNAYLEDFTELARTQLLTAADGEDRYRALRELGRISFSGNIDLFARALRDGNSRVRQEAVRALANTRDPLVIPYLESVLADSKRAVREMARRAIDSILDPSRDPLAGVGF